MTSPLVTDQTMRGTPNLRQFANSANMATEVAAELAGSLSEAIASRGSAVFAAAGGRTPRAVYRQLSQTAVAWQQVLITPTDERCVPPESSESNARMLHSELLQQRAVQARFLSPLEFCSAGDRVGGPLKVRAALPMPLDVVLLGMGEDGHVASLFPGHDFTARPPCAWPWIAVPAGVAGAPPPQPRISLTLDALLSARRLHLIASGRKKRELIDKALEGSVPNPLPIHLIIAMRAQIDIHWSP